MSATNYAISTIQDSIPPQILEKLFRPTDQYGFNNTTMETAIGDYVLFRRVMRDINITGGSQIDLTTRLASRVQKTEDGTLFQFDQESLHGNDIVSVLGFTMGDASAAGIVSGLGAMAGSYEQCTDSFDSNTGGGKRNQMAPLQEYNNSFNTGPATFTRTRLVGKNLVSVMGTMGNIEGWFKVIVTHDSELTDIQPRSWIDFGQIAVNAVKAYVYNKLVITVGEEEIRLGQSLSSFANIIQSYDGAEEEYQAGIKNWAGIAFMNDPVRSTNFIRSQLSPHLL